MDLRDLTRSMEHTQATTARSKAWVALQRGIMLRRGHNTDAVQFAQSLVRSSSERDLIAKAAVGSVTTDAVGLPQASELNDAIMEIVRRTEIIARLLAMGARQVPFLQRFPVVPSRSTVVWVGQGQPISVTRLTLDLIHLAVTKLATIVGFPEEVVESLAPTAERAIERELVRVVRTMPEGTLLSDAAAVADVSPAGLLYGLTPIGGGSPSSISDDLVDQWSANRDGELENPVYIHSLRGGAYLASLRGSDGAPMFPNVGPLGGTLSGVPTLTAHAAGNRLILLDASALAIADGGLETSYTNQTAVQMDDSPTLGAVQMVSAFQSNTVFLKLRRFLNWELAYDDAVSFIELPFDNSPN